MIINPVLYQQGVKLPELENPGTAADLLSGKQLVDQYGNPLTGTMPTATHPKPTLSRSGGTVTAKHVQSSGYTEGGTATETLTIPTKAGTTIMPGTSRKTAVSSGYLTTGAVYVAGDTNLKAENIKMGVSIFGITGEYPPNIMKTRITGNGGFSLDISNINVLPRAVFAQRFLNAYPSDPGADNAVNSFFGIKDGSIEESFYTYGITTNGGSVHMGSSGSKNFSISSASHTLSFGTYNSSVVFKNGSLYDIYLIW